MNKGIWDVQVRENRRELKYEIDIIDDLIHNMEFYVMLLFYTINDCY